ncbi:MAG TPA: hypothetical protein VK775_23690, partial [Chthoniobacterales bacterium]|nr:hypothetical protein [Chthoniobacterales bacterium]
RTLLRRSLLAGALVALGILVVRLSPDPHAQVVVFRFRPPISPVASAPNFSGAGGGRSPLFSVERQVFFDPRFVG